MHVQGWERGSHGTGMGHTTNKGFWIPEKPPTPPREEMLALPEPPRPSGRGSVGRASKRHHKLPAGPKPPRVNGAGRVPKEVKQETDQESQFEDEPPEVSHACLLYAEFCCHLAWARLMPHAPVFQLSSILGSARGALELP